MKISNFTQSELEKLRDRCNFTDMESKCFEMKAKGCTDVQLSVRLNMSESNVAVTMRRVRAKITTVLEEEAKQPENNQSNDFSCGNCPSRVYHTMEEWARIPDFISTKGTEYIYADYRTENGINIPRIKYGDGVTAVSKLPFATMSITDKDMEYWDNKPDTECNDFGKIVEINSTYNEGERFVFPSDGYLMLEFDSAYEWAKVRIYGSSGNTYFEFEKRRYIDIHSKEVFVKKNMECEFAYASEGAKIKFIPLV